MLHLFRQKIFQAKTYKHGAENKYNLENIQRKVEEIQHNLLHLHNPLDDTY